MRKTTIILWLFSFLLMAACGENIEEKKRITAQERARMKKEDSLALKVGTLPTLDCLPLYVAKERRLFDTLGVDVRLKAYQSQIDCEDALVKGKIEGAMTDIVRGQRMIRRGTPLRYVAATQTYWQLISNRKSRIHELRQMEDKMLAMTRFSATHLLSNLATDSVKLKEENVFLVQINDPNIRLRMLLNNELDAMLFTEPQATTARLYKNPVLMDSRDKDLWLGVIAFREKDLNDKRRAEQLQVFLKAYNQACDSINKYGILHYSSILQAYTGADDRTMAALPKIKFTHAASPRDKDIARANAWLK